MNSTEKSLADNNSREELRSKVIGLGEKSFHKNYYGKLKSSYHDMKLFGAVLEQITDVIVLVDKTGHVLNMNQAASSFFCRNKEEMLGLSVSELDGIPYMRLKSDDALTFVQEGADHEGECRSFLFSVKGIVVGVEDYHVLMGRDVSLLIRLQEDQREYENQLHKYQTMDMVSYLAGSVAHDFNNILTGIIGGASLLGRSGSISPDSPERKIVDMILDASEKASELVSNLVNISRKGDGGKDRISLQKVLRDTVEILKHTVDKSIRIEFRNEGADAPVQGSVSALHSAFLNLGINASHAIGSKGRIVFTLFQVSIDEAYCRESSFPLIPGHYLKLIVEDTGCGIPPGNLDRIFDALFTTKEEGKGTGLGLSSVLRTVKDHSGEIRVNSTEGEGTVFSMLFPIAE